MTYGWGFASGLVLPITIAAVDTGSLYYIGLAVVVVIMVGTLIALYRTWEEIHDVEEPDSPAELLESFEKAYAEGELDARELDRVKRLLSAGGGSEVTIRSDHRPRSAAGPAAGPSMPAGDGDSAQVGGPEPSGT